jgi:hypothetical protein
MAAIPPFSNAGFITCSSNTVLAQQLLKVLSGNTSYLQSVISNTINDINYLVLAGALGDTTKVIQEAEMLQQKKKVFIPNYLDRFSNIGEALQQYDNDLRAFQEMIRNCPSAKLQSFVNLLGLNIALPTAIKSLDMALLGYSGLRQAIQEINSFPINYLRNQQQNILENIYRGLAMATTQAEFGIASGLDAVESKMPSMISSLAQEIETIIACVQSISCDDSELIRTEYSTIMQSIPLYPAFNPVFPNKLRPPTSYNLDSSNIFNQTTANPTQVGTLSTARDSVKTVMDYARGQTQRYFTTKA